MTGLSFKKTNIIPKDEKVGPIIHYDYDKVWPKPYEIMPDGQLDSICIIQMLTK